MFILKGHKKAVYALAFTPDGRYLLTGSGDETARLWDLSDGSEVARHHTERHSVLHALVVPGRTPLLTLVGTPNRFWAWEPATGMATLFTPEGGVSDLAFAPGGAYLATSGGPGRVGVRLWDPADWSLIRSWEPQPETTGALAFSPDRTLLATACVDASVTLWDTATWKALGSLPARGPDLPGHLVFDRDGRTLVTATNLVLTSWDTGTRQVVATHKRKGKHYQGLAVSLVGRLLATACNDATARFWLLPELSEREGYTWKIGPILDVEFSPDGFRCAAGGRSGKVVVWDVDG